MTPYDRIIARLNEVHPGWTDRRASLEATDGRNADLLRSIKRGRSTMPRGANFSGLAKVLNVSADWIMGLYDGNAQDPDLPPDTPVPSPVLNPDEPMTIGSETGRRGVPVDASVQVDVTAGMGGGGLTIISEGVPGRSGMTFAAEFVRDFWRLPHEVLAALGLKAADVIVVPVQGDSMSGTLTEGDYVFVDTRHRLPSPDGIYCITDDFGGLVVKRLEVVSRPSDEEIIVRVISDNPKHEPKDRSLSELRIIGRVLRRFGVVG